MSPTFALIGAAGFVAKRHLDAIQAVGGQLVAALDPRDSVGILDSYSTQCRTFLDDYRFERHLLHDPVDYVVVCSPNYMHDFHCRLALQCGSDVICEKPLCLEPHNLDLIQKREQETGKTVHPILQLRVHPELVALKEKWAPGPVRRFWLDYITPRGPWYHRSWKGDLEKSGGILTNLGVHLVDALLWIFGAPLSSQMHDSSRYEARGTFAFDGAVVDWVLSTAAQADPTRKLTEGGTVLADFTRNFGSYHEAVYRRILAGTWIGTEDARPAIEVCAALRERP